uniref:RNA/RNP complex-1-interacting phosphatase n=1 Tax=Romanomermis culicivorax TaxID=13658 RepID=A0A915KIW8_ROMCU
MIPMEAQMWKKTVTVSPFGKIGRFFCRIRESFTMDVRRPTNWGGWEEYKPLGQRIPETRIICCKCPLKEELCRKLPSKSKWFTPQTLFSMLNEENLKLGLVIDLTNTDRYYNPNAFTYADVGYVKIFTPGHDVPAEDAIKKFCDAIKTYEKGVDDKDRVIIVHCTHGVNRTGYLVCHYLIECCGWSYEKAFQAFNLARDHKIERENYLAALMELDNKVNNKPHIFLHDDASDEETTPKKIGTKGRRSNSISSTSSDDSLFKPHKRMPVVVAPVVAMTGSAQVAPLPDALLPPGGMAPAAAANVPFFNPAIMQGLLMNVAHMQQAMMAGRLPPGPPLTVPPAFQTTLPKYAIPAPLPDASLAVCIS